MTLPPRDQRGRFVKAVPEFLAPFHLADASLLESQDEGSCQLKQSSRHAHAHILKLRWWQRVPRWFKEVTR